MICEILLPKPIEKTFYYKTLKFLEPGIVVKVEFKNKKITGVVIKTHKEIIYKKPLKSIDSILCLTPLPNEILKSSEFVANYTCNFKSLILKLFLTGFERNTTIRLEKDLSNMKNNINAVYGAIQQIDKLIVLAKGGKEEKKPMPPEKEKALNIATS